MNTNEQPSRPLIPPSMQEWSEYLKAQIALWPDWKKSTSSYSYPPVIKQSVSLVKAR